MTNEQYRIAQEAKAIRNTQEYKIKLSIAVSELVSIDQIEIEQIDGTDVFFKVLSNRYYATTTKRGDGIRKNSVRRNRY